MLTSHTTEVVSRQAADQQALPGGHPLFRPSSAVAKASGHAVDRQMDRASQFRGIAPPRPQTPQQVDLQVIQRVDVRDPIA